MSSLTWLQTIPFSMGCQAGPSTNSPTRSVLVYEWFVLNNWGLSSPGHSKNEQLFPNSHFGRLQYSPELISYSGFTAVSIGITILSLALETFLAHAFAPQDGRLHYDADENWSTNPTRINQIDLESIAVHEIGHILGFRHSWDPSSIMFAYYMPGTIKRNLGQDDIDGIRALYFS